MHDKVPHSSVDAANRSVSRRARYGLVWAGSPYNPLVEVAP